jgi:alpha-beta hydrolase superfamily lysophospholipase
VSDALIRRTESSFAAPDGARLFRRAWIPDDARRVIVLVHGFAEHSGRYDATASWFTTHRTAVHAYDHRGHGHSDGDRGHVETFDQFLDDLTCFVGLIRDEHPGLPIVVIGHSMGGLILLTWLLERNPAIEAAITSGPALAVGGRRPPWQLRVASLLRRVAPRLNVPSNLPLDGLSTDPEVIRRYEADPLVFKKLSVSLAAELFDASERSGGKGARIAVPLLMLHGADDPICDPDGSRSFHEDVTSPGSDLRIYPGLRHEIFNEPQAPSVYADALEWLEKRGL